MFAICSDFLDKNIIMWMSTINICFYEEFDKTYTDCNLKTMQMLDCALIMREVGRIRYFTSYISRVERKTMVTQTYFWNPCLGATWTPL